MPALERSEVVSNLIGPPEDLLIVAGLGNAANEVARYTGDAPNLFAVDGAMGAAVPVGLGLALAQPRRAVLVWTGDGELLMQLGSLATAAACDPPNLAVVCVDNGQYALTGHQRTHTAMGADLERVAAGAGFRQTLRVADGESLGEGARLVRKSGSSRFIVVEVTPTDVPMLGFERDASVVRARFRRALVAER